MPKLDVRTLHAGLNFKDDPSMMGEGSTEVCVGVDLTVNGVLETATGYAANDISSFLPSGDIDWAQVVYMDGSQYVLATTSGGLYVNGTSEDTAVKGRFKAISVGSNIFITNGTLSRRFDGSTSYQLGITPPTAGPTFSASTVSTKAIDDFEAVGDYTANQINCVCSAEAVIIQEGAQSLQVDITGEQTAYSWRAFGTDRDLTVYATGDTGYDGDLIKCMIYCTDLSKVTRITFMFDVGDESFTEDFYKHSLTLTQANIEATITPGIGESTEIYPEESREISYVPWVTGRHNVPEGTTYEEVLSAHYGDDIGPMQSGAKESGLGEGNIVWDGVKDIQPWTTMFSSEAAVTNELLTDVWCSVRFTKKQCTKIGTSGDWSAVKAMKIQIETLDTVTLYFDDLKLSGGGKLIGDYYFMYGWARIDSDGNVLHYSGPARDSDGNLDIQGPFTFERQKIAWAARTASTDSQVNACVIYIAGGTLNSWMQAYVIEDNLLTTGSIAIGEADIYQPLISLKSNVAPVGNDLVFKWSRLWMVGGSDLVRCSAISPQGDIMLDAWPRSNAFAFTDRGRNLLSIHEMNTQLIVRGEDGAWAFGISNPLDLSTIAENELSTKPCVGEDAFLETQNSLIYPTLGTFMETNGSTAQPVMPEASVAITKSGMQNAVGVFRSLDGFFSFTDHLSYTATARFDMFSGGPRICYHGHYNVDCLFLDEPNDKVYAIVGGTVYLYDSGYSANGAELDLQVRTKEFTFGKISAWTRISFDHNTGGNYFRVRVYIDGEDVGYKPFMSTTRTTTDFWFGPTVGEFLKFQFEGAYDVYGKIYLPVRLYAND